MKAISVSEQFQSSSGAVLVPLTPTGFTAMSFTSWNNCRAIPEQFQSSSGGYLEQFQSNMTWYSAEIPGVLKVMGEQFNCSAIRVHFGYLRAVWEQLLRVISEDMAK